MNPVVSGVISKKYVVEGNENAQDQAIIRCSGNGDSTLNFDRCNEWPYRYKVEPEQISQCTDNTENCSDESKISTCCEQRAQMCQGNIDSQLKED